LQHRGGTKLRGDHQLGGLQQNIEVVADIGVDNLAAACGVGDIGSVLGVRLLFNVCTNFGYFCLLDARTLNPIGFGSTLGKE